MRGTIRTLALSVSIAVFASTLPAHAATQDREPRMRDRGQGIVRVVKTIVKRAFGIGTNSTPTIPIPEPTHP